MKYFRIPSVMLIFTLLVFQSCILKEKKRARAIPDCSSKIDSLLNTAVRNNEIPGAVAFILRDGNVVLHKSYGYRNLENKIPMQKNDIFRMASMTKALTAVAVLQLNERGLLQLDDNLSKFIPEFKNPDVLISVFPDSSYSARPAKKEITIRQLLTHTSGLGYGFQDERYNALILKNKISEGFEDDDRTSIENIRRLAKLPLLNEPGEKYTYSLSYDVLSVVVETVSGLRFDKYIKKNILDPLGMSDSFFLVPQSQQKRLVDAYQPATNGKGLEPTQYSDTEYPKIETRQYFSGGADLCSTAADYSKFIQMVKNKGVFKNTRILGQPFIEMMLSKQTNLDDDNYDQGFATWITNAKGASVGPMSQGSFGFGGFWDTYGWADPHQNLVAVLLLQMYPNNQYQIHEKFKAIVYGQS